MVPHQLVYPTHPLAYMARPFQVFFDAFVVLSLTVWRTIQPVILEVFAAAYAIAVTALPKHHPVRFVFCVVAQSAYA